MSNQSIAVPSHFGALGQQIYSFPNSSTNTLYLPTIINVSQ